MTIAKNELRTIVRSLPINFTRYEVAYFISTNHSGEVSSVPEEASNDAIRAFRGKLLLAGYALCTDSYNNDSTKSNFIIAVNVKGDPSFGSKVSSLASETPQIHFAFQTNGGEMVSLIPQTKEVDQLFKAVIQLLASKSLRFEHFDLFQNNTKRVLMEEYS